MVKVKVKQSHYSPGQVLKVLRDSGSQISRQSAHGCGKVVSPTHRPPLPPRNYLWFSFLLEADSPQGHSVAGRIMSMKNSNDTIGNRTRDLPACSTVPQATVPPRSPYFRTVHKNIVYSVLVGKPEGRRPLGRPRRRCDGNIKMNLREVGCGDMEWIELAQDRDVWRSPVNTVMNLLVP
jgi:hypothetical protein